MINAAGRIGGYGNTNMTADQIRAEMKFRDYTPDQKLMTIHNDVVQLNNKADVIQNQNNIMMEALAKLLGYEEHNAFSTGFDRVA